MDEGYTAELDQRLAKMNETARLAAAFYKGMIQEGITQHEAALITAIYAISINSDDGEGLEAE